MLDSTTPAACATAPTPAPRLGAHHFAHLRACAEGIDVLQSARRFLGTGHGHEARTAHRQTTQAVRAVARRRGESAWRLIGLTIAPQTGAGAPVPSLEEFAAERGLDGWSQAELAQMHAEAYALPAKAQRREQLRQRQLDLLRRLQALAAQTPLASDSVSGWFDDATAAKLITAGMTTLGQLQEKITLGGRWFQTLPAVGSAKAQRIQAHLALLLPQGQARPRFGLGAFSRAAPGIGQAPGALHAGGAGAIVLGEQARAPTLPMAPASPPSAVSPTTPTPPAALSGAAPQPGHPPQAGIVPAPPGSAMLRAQRL